MECMTVKQTIHHLIRDAWANRFRISPMNDESARALRDTRGSRLALQPGVASRYVASFNQDTS